ncbi:flagellar motor protein MotB [Halomonas sp. YLGW01]|uniref:flagellar motor protein MotB n=1 Tax=Halomonas sp. YLGW01 TaxID=2773308 RepID=UPI00177FD44C|nr:flagellar motor protein MotB [Halomonas sp. YLGW01]
MSEQGRPIIIRRKKVVHGHHGGSWKIALADFMTALMALFLVMWILSSASQEQRQGVAEYFNTPLLTAIAGGEQQANSQNVIPGGGPDPTFTEGQRQRIDRRIETRPSEMPQRLRELRRSVENAIQADPVLRKLRNQLRFDMTREGLRIQLVDTDKRPMFELGSDRVASYMRRLLRTLAPLLNEVPNPVSISGHTDSVPYVGGLQGYSNWELSTDRANASRRELVAGGLERDKLLRVAGMGDQVPMPDSAPGDAINRRIALVVLYRQVAESIRSQGGRGESIGVPSARRAPDAPLPTEEFVEGVRQTLSG